MTIEELKKAQAEGKIIQYNLDGGWVDWNNPSFDDDASEYRIKPFQNRKWCDNYEDYQNACNSHTETYTTANGMIAIAR